MKVALVSPYDFLQPGGVNTHVRHLAAALRSRGVEAAVLACVSDPRGAPPWLLPLGGRLVTLRSAGARARVSLDPRVVGRLRALLRRHAFDVVHLHNPLSPLVSLGALASRAVVPDTAFVATFHEYRARLNPAMELAKRALRPWIDRLDGRIAVSAPALEFNRRRFPGDYRVIPNGVDTARLGGDGARASAAPRPPTILFVGRLEARKGFIFLLEAVRRLAPRGPGARLVAAGPADAPTRRRLAAFAAAHGLDGVELVGRVGDDELAARYRDADVFCAPSVDCESFGIVVLEAMAAGLPVVASDIPAYRALVEEGRHGLLVQPGDPAAIARALETLLADAGRRRAMAAAGRATAARFDWSRVAGEILGFYAETLERRAGRAAVMRGAATSIPSSDL